MPKLKPETLEARREHILDAAERCFARSGFHRCTMADICGEAAISAGALYVHFESKEALIAGIVERNRAQLSDELADLANAPDFTAALAALGEHYAVEEPQYKRILNLEIAAEATRNEKIAELFQNCDRFVIDSFTELIERATREGRINPVGDARKMAQTICIIGEGMFWRRAVDPAFNGRELMGSVMTAVSALLNAPKLDDDANRDGPADARVAETHS
ncbi:MAG: TetR family transcriptional regulator [Alphaproteobacteria bacterium BRH_c36]|nr:MAG: TetR family transcriptional regulator [Alphaproteobacteria bacterium BRH_c36]